jgi:hypothetical protein
MQLMPGTAASVGVSNPFDPNQSALGGATYLNQMYAKYGDWNLALEAYNEGPGALDANLAAGVTPVAAGYASSVLAAAGLPAGGADSGLDLSTSDASLSDVLDLSGNSTNWPLIGLAVLGGLVVFMVAR